MVDTYAKFLYFYSCNPGARKMPKTGGAFLCILTKDFFAKPLDFFSGL
jgi:hypothetical protein